MELEIKNVANVKRIMSTIPDDTRWLLRVGKVGETLEHFHPHIEYGATVCFAIQTIMIAADGKEYPAMFIVREKDIHKIVTIPELASDIKSQDSTG